MRITFRNWTVAARWLSAAQVGTIPERMRLAIDSHAPTYLLRDWTSFDCRYVLGTCVPGMLVTVPRNWQLAT